jgi:hypothetical protein
VKPLRLDFEKLFERSQPLSRSRLVFDSPQFFTRVLLDYRQIDLHLTSALISEHCKPHARPLPSLR